jgi:hypothetical protein
VGDQNGAETDLRSIAEFNAIGILVFKVNVISDEDPSRYLYAPQLVDERPDGRAAGRKPGQHP